MNVFVKSKNGNWLMPTSPAKARVLLKTGKAKVVKRVPFSIQLNYESTEYVQPALVGIDDGGVYVGVAAVVEENSLYQEELHLRTDVKKKMDTRKSYRGSRRNRKTRHRKARFLNRKSNIPRCKVCGGNAPQSQVICGKCLRDVDGRHQAYADVKKSEFRLPPSIKAKKDAIIRCVKNVPLPISEFILEDAFFDVQALMNPDIKGEEYQFGPLFFHKNYKQACLARDKYMCRVCKAKETLQAHHVVYRENGGTDILSNLMTLCASCHRKHHQEGLALPRQKVFSFASMAHVQQGKNYLHQELSKMHPVKKTFGFITASLRKDKDVAKSHVNDAAVMAGGTPQAWFVETHHLASRKRSLHEATPRKGRKVKNTKAVRNAKNTPSMKGFHRHDTVVVFGQEGYLAGFTSTSACRVIDARGKFIKKPGKSYTNINLSEVRRVHKNQGMVSFLKAA